MNNQDPNATRTAYVGFDDVPTEHLERFMEAQTAAQQADTDKMLAILNELKDKVWCAAQNLAELHFSGQYGVIQDLPLAGHLYTQALEMAPPKHPARRSPIFHNLCHLFEIGACSMETHPKAWGAIKNIAEDAQAVENTTDLEFQVQAKFCMGLIVLKRKDLQMAAENFHGVLNIMRDAKAEGKIPISGTLEYFAMGAQKNLEKLTEGGARAPPVPPPAAQQDTLAKSSNQKKAVTAKEKGNAFFKAKSYDEAVNAYSAAINFDPKCAVYYSNRAQAQLMLKNFADAEKDCDAALAIEETVKALMRRATARKGKGDLQAAVSDFERVLKLEPQNKQASSDLAEAKASLIKSVIGM